ncbi:MAG: hypothetical protein QM776_15025 [Rhodocyclaceae bacterium]
MKYAIAKCLLGLALITSLAGCFGTPVQLSREVDLSQFDMTKGRRVSGDAGGFQLLYLIPISLNDRHARAYNQMMEAAGDAYVTDIKVYEAWNYAFVGTVYRTSIEGTAYPRKQPVPKP